jgi:N-acetylglucosaminyldiphosphoundecaprenol N-acetyl-beta-D-mannosaminyltransferase
MRLYTIQLQNFSKQQVLEKVENFIDNPGPMRHLVSLNAENLIIAKNNKGFRVLLQSADIKLNDGAGVLLAAKIRGWGTLQRYTGVDFMQEIIKRLQNRRLRVLLLGGKPDLAVKLAKRYSQTTTNMQFKGLSAINNIIKYQEESEGQLILKEIRDYKPHLIFAAFGSPFQEKWFWNHRDELKGVVCVGVGGAFDFLSGEIGRAPLFMQNMGLEWLYRLILQPWRLKRQTRLLTFLWDVIIGKA